MHRFAMLTFAAVLAAVGGSEASAAPKLTAKQIAARKKCTDTHKAEIARCEAVFETPARIQACKDRALLTYHECLERNGGRTVQSSSSPSGPLGDAPDTQSPKPTAKPGDSVREQSVGSEATVQGEPGAPGRKLKPETMGPKVEPATVRTPKQDPPTTEPLPVPPPR